MEQHIYNLVAKSDLYKAQYNIRASSLLEASKLAKIKFAKSYRVFGNNVKISLDPGDLKNHIDEILDALHK